MRRTGWLAAAVAVPLAGCGSALVREGPWESGRAAALGSGDSFRDEALAGAAEAMPSFACDVSRPLPSAGVRPQVNNTGWRVGAVYLEGDGMSLLRQKYDFGNMLSAWGYQFELVQGQPDATSMLVEFVPLIMGLDQSMIIPSLNLLVGLRLRNDFEFGIGPHYSPRADSYFHDDIHVDGLGLAVSVGYTWATEGGVNIPLSLTAMFSGDIQAYGVTLGWNMPQ